jgi:poly-gamma-glutamate synthesis protein (capsule biosynthesis protein)
MQKGALSSNILVVLSIAMIAGGLALGLWALTNSPFGAAASSQGQAGLAEGTGLEPAVGAGTAPNSFSASAASPETQPSSQAAMPSAGETAASDVPAGLPLLAVDIGDAPSSLQADLLAAATRLSDTVLLTTTAAVAPAIRFGVTPLAGAPVYTVTFAVASRFDTVAPALTAQEVRRNWSSGTVSYTQIAVLSDTLPALQTILGEPGPTVRGYAATNEVVDAAWQDRTTLALLPFEQLEPRLATFAVDGQNPLDNSAHYTATAYPLIAGVYAEIAEGSTVDLALARKALAALPAGNRLPEHLTVVAMTGVTAMCRQTAAQMDRLGAAWPAEVVGPLLSSADITHISNEVPFVPGCETNTSADNLTFCSKPEYMEALTASGVDIIGLTGNHQNDYGRANALVSLDIYEEADLPVYGGGRNKQAAFAPLVIEHNGNRLAFLGANSYGPKFAWATDDQPGSAEFDLAIMSAMVRELKQEDKADVVLAELQYQESYDTQPLLDQRQDFTALVRAGADIVTGVQSHVPQGMEFTDGNLVLYGLGNLYFDQMWDQATREGMIVEHTIYAGRHVGTQVLTTLLYDYGQPRWTTPAERDSILTRVFANSYW